MRIKKPRCRQSYVTDKSVEVTGGKPRIMILEVPFQISFVVIQRCFNWCEWRCCMFLLKRSRWIVRRMCGRSSVTSSEIAKGVNWRHTDIKGCSRGTADRRLTWWYATSFSLRCWNVVQNCKLCWEIIWWTIRHVNDTLKSGKTTM